MFEITLSDSGPFLPFIYHKRKSAFLLFKAAYLTVCLCSTGKEQNPPDVTCCPLTCSTASCPLTFPAVSQTARTENMSSSHSQILILFVHRSALTTISCYTRCVEQEILRCRQFLHYCACYGGAINLRTIVALGTYSTSES